MLVGLLRPTLPLEGSSVAHAGRWLWGPGLGRAACYGFGGEFSPGTSWTKDGGKSSSLPIPTPTSAHCFQKGERMLIK